MSSFSYYYSFWIKRKSIINGKGKEKEEWEINKKEGVEEESDGKDLSLLSEKLNIKGRGWKKTWLHGAIFFFFNNL